jgi:methyl-accepting chemotaxis protein
MKFFKVATEGDTTDGREISRDWISQMANNYDPQKYGARIWCEHIRGVAPDAIFKAFGDVTALKTEEVDGKLTLLAQLNPTPELVALNKQRQKVYSSIEIDPNFANSGEAYLVGLAVTDSPASLGTEMLQFCQTAKNNPLSSRKQNKDNLFTAANEVSLDFETEGNGESIFGKFMREFSAFTDKFGKGTEQNIKEVLDQVSKFGEVVGNDFKKFSDTITAQEKTITELTAKVKNAELAIQEFRSIVDKIPEGEGRDKSTGGDGQVKTDC